MKPILSREIMQLQGALSNFFAVSFYAIGCLEIVVVDMF
jgi:hypothetical protein